MKAPLNTKMLTPRQCAMVLKALGDENRLNRPDSLASPALPTGCALAPYLIS